MNGSTFARYLTGFMLACNSYALYVVINTGMLETSYPGHRLESPRVAAMAWFFISAFYLYLYLAFRIGGRLRNQSRFPVERYQRKAGLRTLASLVVAVQIVYIYAIATEGAGAAGGLANASQTVISSVLTLFRVDDFALLFMLTYREAPLFRLNFALYFVSFILRGWLSVLISGLVILFFKTDLRNRPVRILAVAAFAVFIVSALPFLLLIRNDMRLSDDYLHAWFLVSHFGNFDYDLLDGFHGLLMRFQQLESLTFFLQNLPLFQRLYDHSLITPIYFDGPVVSTIYKALVGANSQPLGLVLAEQSRELLLFRKSAVSPGVLAYCVLDYFSAVYALGLPLLFGYATTYFPRSSYFSVACFFFATIYFSFGWSNAVLGSLVSIATFIGASRYLIYPARFHRRQQAAQAL